MFLIIITNPASARMTRVFGSDAEKELAKCGDLVEIKNKDDFYRVGSDGTECCSKEYRYCIYCPKKAFKSLFL